MGSWIIKGLALLEFRHRTQPSVLIHNPPSGINSRQSALALYYDAAFLSLAAPPRHFVDC